MPYTDAMAARGFKVITAGSVAEGLTQVELNAPGFALVDLRLRDGCGLAIVESA
jgi:two-component system, response regulator RegA